MLLEADSATGADVAEQLHPVQGQISAEMRALMAFDPESGVITFNHGGAPGYVVRQFIRTMTDALNALPGALEGLPVEHVAIDGMLSRAMFIPKGMLLVGKIHKLDCINIVASGDISILTEKGSGRMVAGQQAVSPAGTQKIGFANEDTVFINIFRTNESRLEHIEDTIGWPSFEEFDLAEQRIATIAKE